MPRGDRRGPDGMGPMTGRGMGYCAGFDSPGFTRPTGYGGRWGRGGGGQRGRGYGGGFGRGYGRGVVPMVQGWRPYPDAGYAPAPVDEASLLKNQAEYLEEALKDVKDRLSALEDKE